MVDICVNTFLKHDICSTVAIKESTLWLLRQQISTFSNIDFTIYSQISVTFASTNIDFILTKNSLLQWYITNNHISQNSWLLNRCDLTVKKKAIKKLVITLLETRTRLGKNLHQKTRGQTVGEKRAKKTIYKHNYELQRTA